MPIIGFFRRFRRSRLERRLWKQTRIEAGSSYLNPWAALYTSYDLNVPSDDWINRRECLTGPCYFIDIEISEAYYQELLENKGPTAELMRQVRGAAKNLSFLSRLLNSRLFLVSDLNGSPFLKSSIRPGYVLRVMVQK